MLTKRTRVVVAVVLLAGAVGVGWTLQGRNKAMVKRCDHPFTDLQDARKTAEAKAILMDWNAKDQNTQIKRDMNLDRVFPFFYAPLLALLCYSAATDRPTRWMAGLGWAAAVAVLLAGVCDFAENTTMLSMVGHEELSVHLSKMLPFTLLKGGLLIVAVLYLMLAHLDTRELPSPT